MATAAARAARDVETLYREHVGAVYRYAYAVLGNHADAEDVTQTTFVNAMRALERGEQPRKAENWLLTIAHNIVRQRWRQIQSRPAEVELDRDVSGRAPDDDAPDMADVVRALQRIPPSQRAALVMRELEGRSYQEIGEILGLTTAALETLLFRARRSLAEEMESLVTCEQAELAISRRLDGRLSRKDRRRLEEHLEGCASCARMAKTQQRYRGALKGLTLLPLPISLTFFKGAPSAAAAAGLPTIGLGAAGSTIGGSAAAGGAGAAAGGSAAGGAFLGSVAAKVAAVVVSAAAVGGGGYAGLKQLEPKESVRPPVVQPTFVPVASTSRPTGDRQGRPSTVGKRPAVAQTPRQAATNDRTVSPSPVGPARTARASTTREPAPVVLDARAGASATTTSASAASKTSAVDSRPDTSVTQGATQAAGDVPTTVAEAPVSSRVDEQPREPSAAEDSPTPPTGESGGESGGTPPAGPADSGGLPESPTAGAPADPEHPTKPTKPTRAKHPEHPTKPERPTKPEKPTRSEKPKHAPGSSSDDDTKPQPTVPGDAAERTEDRDGDRKKSDRQPKKADEPKSDAARPRAEPPATADPASADEAPAAGSEAATGPAGNAPSEHGRPDRPKHDKKPADAVSKAGDSTPPAGEQPNKDTGPAPLTPAPQAPAPQAPAPQSVTTPVEPSAADAGTPASPDSGAAPTSP